MGQPADSPSRSAVAASRPRAIRTVFASISFAVFAAGVFVLIQPIRTAVAGAVCLSIALYQEKKHMANSCSLLTTVASLTFGDPLFSAVKAAIGYFLNQPSQTSSAESLDSLESPNISWSTWALKWAVRTSVVSALYFNDGFRKAFMLFSLAWISFYAAQLLLVPASARPATINKVFENTQVSLRVILITFLLPSAMLLYFSNNLISASPDLIYSGVSFLAKPLPSYTPNRNSFIPDFGIRKMALELGVSELRNSLITYIDSEALNTFSVRNFSCVEAAHVALSGLQVYKEKLNRSFEFPYLNMSSRIASIPATEQFRTRFPQTVEMIEFAAEGQRINAFIASGGAIAEIRWLGEDAFKLTTGDEKGNDYSPMRMNQTVTKESLDPTQSLPGLVAPIIADLAFNGLVFFSTLWVLVSSELGVQGYLTKLVGQPLSHAITNPLAASFRLNWNLAVFRISLTHLLSLLVFPMSSQSFATLLPFVAFATTYFPMLPPFLTLGIIPAAILFIAYGAPFAALLVLYVQVIWTPEGIFLSECMGTDGIAVLDGFSLWMGWMAFDAPIGLIVGPWVFLAVRKCYRVFCEYA